MLVFGKDVDVQWSKRDRYQRIVGKVLVADPTCQRRCPKTLDAGLAQVTAGLAWWYRKYAKEQSAEDAQRYGSLSRRHVPMVSACGRMDSLCPRGIGERRRDERQAAMAGNRRSGGRRVARPAARW